MSWASLHDCNKQWLINGRHKDRKIQVLVPMIDSEAGEGCPSIRPKNAIVLWNLPWRPREPCSLGAVAWKWCLLDPHYKVAYSRHMGLRVLPNLSHIIVAKVGKVAIILMNCRGKHVMEEWNWYCGWNFKWEMTVYLLCYDS